MLISYYHSYIIRLHVKEFSTCLAFFCSSSECRGWTFVHVLVPSSDIWHFWHSQLQTVKLWDTLLGRDIKGWLLNLDVQSEMNLNHHDRNLNNSTSFLTSTIILSLFSHDSELKVSCQMYLTPQSYQTFQELNWTRHSFCYLIFIIDKLCMNVPLFTVIILLACTIFFHLYQLIV